jgi:hypothetical protein
LKNHEARNGRRAPSNLVLAIGTLTGLDYRYFLLPQNGGIRLKRGERIFYDKTSKTFAIVNTSNAAKPAEARVAELCL